MAFDQKSRFEHLITICRALPGVVHQPQGDHSAFLVKGKTFAYYLANHHEDGIWAVCCKVLPGDNETLIRQGPERFYMPDYIGPRGWVGLRLDLESVDWQEVAELVRGSYYLQTRTRVKRQAGSSY
jgi:hypothetical protein